jgi:predicted GH43/DUF377 family glycosyl hydrolase
MTTPITPTIPRFTVERLGIIMAPSPTEWMEYEGVCNPGGVLGRDGSYYLFPRLVAKGNHSRIGIARVQRDYSSRPRSVERLGLALSAYADYERPVGCEDARVTYVEAMDCYVMTYTAVGPEGPRVALAYSDDLRDWQRDGLARWREQAGLDHIANAYNKDAVLFPDPVFAPDGRPALALLHRPILAVGVRPSIYISYCPLETLEIAGCPIWEQHRLLVKPELSWECDRIGAGCPPIKTVNGWLVFYHGVSWLENTRHYQAGALLLDTNNPHTLLARSTTPIFGPKTLEERTGTVPMVTFPTAADVRPNGDIDVYYGAADYRICAVRLHPTGGQ